MDPQTRYGVITRPLINLSIKYVAEFQAIAGYDGVWLVGFYGPDRTEVIVLAGEEENYILKEID